MRLSILFLVLLTGCSQLKWKPTTQPLKQPTDKLIQLDDCKIQFLMPIKWHEEKEDANLLYTHRQFADPDFRFAVGVVYIRLPLPFDPHTLVSFLKSKYETSDKKHGEGKILAQWDDKENRCWVEAEDDKYHARAYVVCKGYDAWVVYSGYKVWFSNHKDQIFEADHACETFRPYSKNLAK